MAGAFVAVADDASAAYWNPAGLVVGAPLGTTIGWNRFQTGNRNAPPAPGPTLRNATFASLATGPSGSPTAGCGRRGWRPARGARWSPRRSRPSRSGATLVQTIVPGLVVGSTLKYLRGSFAQAHLAARRSRTPWTGHGPRRSRREPFDFDIGLMADLKKVRWLHRAKSAGTAVYEQCRNCNHAAEADQTGVAFLPDRWPDPCYGCRPGHGRPPGRPSSNDRLGRRRPPGLARRRAWRRAVGLKGDVPAGDRARVERQSLRSRFWLEGTTAAASVTKTAASRIGFRAG